MLYTIKNYYTVSKIIKYLFFLKNNIIILFYILRSYISWLLKFNIFFIFDFIYLFFFKKLFIYGHKQKHKLCLSFRHFYLSMKLNFNIFLNLFFLNKNKCKKLIFVFLNKFFLYVIFLLDYFASLDFFYNTLIYKLFYYFFSLYSVYLYIYIFIYSFNFLKIFFFLIKFFFKELLYFSRLIHLIYMVYYKYRYVRSLKVKSILKSIMLNNFFFKKKDIYIFNYYKRLYFNRFDLNGYKLGLNFLYWFFNKLIINFNKFFYFLLNLLNILKMYKKRLKLFKCIINYKGIFFSKQYKSWKYINFPYSFFWKSFNYKVLYFWYNLNSYRYAYKNSIVLKRFFNSFFNIKNIKKFSVLKLICKRKFNWRVRNFFFFFELRIFNILRRLGFVQNSFLFNSYNKFFLFKKFNSFFFIKNSNYMVKLDDLVVLNFKFYKFEKLNFFFLNSFLEVNYKIKSFFLIRLPFLSEILKKWSVKFFNRSLYSYMFR